MGRSPGREGQTHGPHGCANLEVDGWPAGKRNETPGWREARPGAQIIRGVFQKPFSGFHSKVSNDYGILYRR